MSSLKKHVLLQRQSDWLKQVGYVPGADVEITQHPAIRNEDCVQSCTVYVDGLVGTDDVVHDDEYSETCDDVQTLAAEYGTVLGVRIPLASELSSTTVTITYTDAQAAAAAVAGLHGRVIAGALISASTTAFPRNSDGPDHDDNTPELSTYTVAIQNLVHADELTDSDDYAEVCHNVTALGSQYGSVARYRTVGVSSKKSAVASPRRFSQALNSEIASPKAPASTNATPMSKLTSQTFESARASRSRSVAGPN